MEWVVYFAIIVVGAVLIWAANQWDDPMEQYISSAFCFLLNIGAVNELCSYLCYCYGSFDGHEHDWIF